MNKRVISIDCDGVLDSFESGVVPIVNRLWPEKNVPANYIPQNWDWTELLTKEQWTEVWSEIKKTPFFWASLDPIADNVMAMNDYWQTLNELSVYFITSRPDTTRSAQLQTQRWLREYGILNHGSVLVVRDPTQKRCLIQAIGASASIDDFLPTAVSHAEIDNHTSYLLDRPWNRENRPEETKQFRVVSKLADFLEDQRLHIEG